MNVSGASGVDSIKQFQSSWISGMDTMDKGENQELNCKLHGGASS